MEEADAMLLSGMTLTATLTLAMTDAAAWFYLQKWEAAAKATQTYAGEVTFTRTDLLLKQKSESTGSLACRKPNQAVVSLKQTVANGGPARDNSAVTYIWTGMSVFEYDAVTATVTEYPITADQSWGHVSLKVFGGQFTVMFRPRILEFVGGSMTAERVLSEYAVKAVKRDENYVYLHLLPCSEKDRAEFDSIIAVIYGPGGPAKERGFEYTPRSLFFRKNSGQIEELWDFVKPVLNQKLADQLFVDVGLPPGWKLHRIPGRKP